MMPDDGNRDLQAFCTTGMLNFTKYMFPQINKKKFIVNEHHKIICDTLDAVIDGKLKKVIFNIAPRYSKSELVVKNFMSYGFAINPSCNFIHISYSDDLANDNSEEVRDIVKSEHYRELFPYVEIKKGSDSKKKWSTTAGGGVYAVASGGQITGFGAGIMDEEEMTNAIDSVNTEKFAGAIIIDDPIKPDDAMSELVRERVNNRFETTIRNRVNSRNTPIIIIMQRVHEHDLCGYLLELEPEEWTVISLPCLYVDEQGEECALWPFKHTVEELHKIRDNNSYVFETQYQQDPKPIEGLMYHEFKTYDTIPRNRFSKRKNYTDTADTGSDYLCSLCYEEHPDYNYVTDILYTKKPMEYTEPKTAEMIARNSTEECYIESNNGGRGFARNVESQLNQIGYTSVWIQTFTQSDNKNVRIFTNSAGVNNVTVFPFGWEKRWPEFYKSITNYRKEGNNKNDDAEDVITGAFEKRKQGEVIPDAQILNDLR